ncbi:MAG: PqqD family protein [Lachnospiraceae bacterium]|nr:PqqD family protein [Lachnospiraceae bacterium]
MKKTDRFITREVAGEHFLIPVNEGTQIFNGLITLSESAVFIYEHIEETSSFEDLLSQFRKEYRVPEETAKQDIAEFLNQMLQVGMITFSNIQNYW